jgi:tetraacyldisaccharide 4'-kinase
MQSLALKGVPVVVGASRYKAALSWLQCGHAAAVQPAVWVLDDGFQHRQLHRDLDIVLLDADKPFGPLLPKGLFREPPEALQRAQALVFTRATERLPRKGDLVYPEVMNSKIQVSKSQAVYARPKCVWPAAQDDSVGETPKEFFVVAGIARPESLKSAMKDLSLGIAESVFFEDHQAIDGVRVKAENQKSFPILTTAKDWARSEKEFVSLGVSVWVLPMTLELPPQLKALVIG